jgi:hypothetical protein
MKTIELPDQPRTVQLANAGGQPVTVEIAPGEAYADLPAEQAPRVGIVRWVPAGDGLFRPRVQLLENWIRTTHAPQFGIHIKPETLVRLGNSGFIKFSQTSPGHNAVCLESLLDHIEKCRDPEFWTTERRKQYTTAFWRFRQSDKE